MRRKIPIGTSVAFDFNGQKVTGVVDQYMPSGRVVVVKDDYGTGYVEALDDLTVVKPDKEPVLKPEEKKEH